MQDHSAPPSVSAGPPIPAEAQRAFAAALERVQGGDGEGAARLYRFALELGPGHVEAANNLAVLLAQQGRVPAAIAHLRRALTHRPEAPLLLVNLAIFLHQQRCFDEAEVAASCAIALSPDDPDALFIGGLLRRSRGDDPGAIRQFDRALIGRPRHVETRWNRALALLASGDYARGFAEYEVRWQRKETVVGHFTMPMWQGEDPAGRAILVHAEQGYGDNIQFCRLMPLLARRGCRVLFSCPPEMMRLMAGFPGISDLLVFGAPMPCEVHFHAPLLSLAHRLGVTLENLGAPRPYLFVPPGVSGPPIPRSPDTRLTVGIVWAGNPAHGNDNDRSAPLETFLTLADLPGVQLISLQKGPRTADIAVLGVEGLIHDLGSAIKDFADSAAVLARLDLLVAVDTAPVHLAGALGRPAFVLLAHLPDWRWLRQRADTPWYSSLRLFRQETPRDWDGVLRRVRGEIEAILARR
ncbi:MAG TPA: tetratricopeptide repeat protein [Stellaceae bacterium]|nr:tetratricopeptide repeat protein [Stellaceae bacterium]